MRLIGDIIMMGVRMEAILGCFSEERAKWFLGRVHEAHGDCKNGGRGKMMRSVKDGGRPNYRRMSQERRYLELDGFRPC